LTRITSEKGAVAGAYADPTAMLDRQRRKISRMVRRARRADVVRARLMKGGWTDVT